MRATVPEIVPATTELLERFRGRAAARTAYAVAVLEGDKVLGIGGVHLDGYRWVAFCEISPEARADIRKYRRELIKASRHVLGIASRFNMPVHAAPDPAIETAPAFLRHLGFEHIGKGVYQWTR